MVIPFYVKFCYAHPAVLVCYTWLSRVILSWAVG